MLVRYFTSARAPHVHVEAVLSDLEREMARSAEDAYREGENLHQRMEAGSGVPAKEVLLNVGQARIRRDGLRVLEPKDRAFIRGILPWPRRAAGRRRVRPARHESPCRDDREDLGGSGRRSRREHLGRGRAGPFGDDGLSLRGESALRRRCRSHVCCGSPTHHRVDARVPRGSPTRGHGRPNPDRSLHRRR